MATFMDDLYDRFHELHSDMVKTVTGLPTEALDWAPGQEMNSMNALVAHLVGAERYLFSLVLDETTERDREAEFKAKGLSSQDLVKMLNEADEFIHQTLGRLALQDLSGLHLSPRSQKNVSAGWAILHALEHTATHVGHAQLSRQLWEQR